MENKNERVRKKWADGETQITFTNEQIVTLITYLQATSSYRQNTHPEGFKKDVDKIQDFLISEMEKIPQ